jgi:hypothetical protein
MVSDMEKDTMAMILETCHCGVVIFVKLELLNWHIILMLDEEQVVALDYLLIF